MKNKSNLKLAATQTKAQADEEWLKIGQAVRDERHQEFEHLKLSDAQRRAVLHDFLDRTEQTAFEALVQFGSGLADCSGVWSHGPEGGAFIEMLHPWMKPDDARIDAALFKIHVQGDPATQDLQSDFEFMKWTRQETGFKLGILIGARLAGCPPEKVKKMAEYLVDTLR